MVGVPVPVLVLVTVLPMVCDLELDGESTVGVDRLIVMVGFFGLEFGFSIWFCSSVRTVVSGGMKSVVGLVAELFVL